jgi:hypothetical protein
MFLGALFAAPEAGSVDLADHQEFEAVLVAPFRADASGARALRLHFSAPGGQPARALRWRLDLLGPDGRRIRTWRRQQTMSAAQVDVEILWRAQTGLRSGIYSLRLRAGVDGEPDIEQRWEVAVGPASPAMASLAPALPPPAALPYAVYLGNLHSQTNHSDGGGALDHCDGAQPPQSAALGPSDAYDYAQRHGLRFLMTSEHNHMYDGSDGTNAGADTAAARALYRSGLQAASDWNRTHPDLLAVYGQEWGVISHGGHLNILNSTELLGWERNAQGELLADTETPKGDYAGLYRLMRARGWVGQFNHPQNGQFAVDGKPLAWTADGDEVMLLCEVMNSSAFSTHADEGETHLSNYEATCDKLLEAGYHLAFSSNQDNHCANWGAAYGNRTGVLIERGKPLDGDNLLAALRARRVFATMDKRAQLLLTGNGHLMGERFRNRGKLTLQVSHTSANGRSPASIALFHGVPGRNGMVEKLAAKASTVLTPAAGEHFYYARVTQDDGKILWSAPIWVSQDAR